MQRVVSSKGVLAKPLKSFYLFGFIVSLHPGVVVNIKAMSARLHFSSLEIAQKTQYTTALQSASLLFPAGSSSTATHASLVWPVPLQSQHSHLVIQQLLGHLDANSKSSATVRAGIVEVLLEAAAIAASGSVGE